MSFLGLPSAGSASLASAVADILAIAPRYTWWVFGDSTDGGTTPDATTQASINALIAAGIPETNIRWLYEVFAPTISSIVAGDTQLTVNWGNVAGETSYEVYYSTNANLTDTTIDGSTAYPGSNNATAGKFTGLAANTVQKIITGLTNGTIYYIRVYAVSGAIKAGSVTASGAPLWTFAGANGTAIDSALSPLTAGGGTITHDGTGYAKIVTGNIADGAIFYLPHEFVRGAAKTGRFKFKCPSTTDLTSGNILYMILRDSAAKDAPFAGVVTTANTKINAQIYNASGVMKLIFRYYDNAGASRSYDFSANSWVAEANEVLLNLTIGTEYWLSLITSATGWKLQLKDAADATVLEETPEVTWGNTIGLTNKQWLLIGDPFTEYFYGTLYINEAHSF